MTANTLDLVLDKAPRTDGLPSRELTRRQRLSMARLWINAMLDYGSDLKLVEYSDGYVIQFLEPLEPTEEPWPRPYDKEIAVDVRDLLRAMGRTIDYRHAKLPRLAS